MIIHTHRCRSTDVPLSLIRNCTKEGPRARHIARICHDILELDLVGIAIPCECRALARKHGIVEDQTIIISKVILVGDLRLVIQSLCHRRVKAFCFVYTPSKGIDLLCIKSAHPSAQSTLH